VFAFSQPRLGRFDLVRPGLLDMSGFYSNVLANIYGLDQLSAGLPKMS
jgi:hypothetical protein